MMPTAISSLDLAFVAGWSEPQAIRRSVLWEGTTLDVCKVAIAGKPAALFSQVVARNDVDPTDVATLFAYHASVEWSVCGDEEGFTVLNPHWLVDGRWFRFPKVAWGGSIDGHPLLNAFSPNALVRRELSRLASVLREPTDILSPVDDALVERLDQWRDQAIRYSPNTYRVDDLLQTFYAQIFVLRTVEDRKLQPDLPTLTELFNGPDQIDRTFWSDLLERAKLTIGSDLFDIDVARNIPDHVMSGVIRDLYVPRNVPGRRVRYDFSWIDADVLGLAYEKYLATVLQPTSLPTQVDLFLPAEREVERRSVRKAAGAYYTPKYMTQYIATRCIDDFFLSGATQPPSIIDFACGSGSFLAAAVSAVLAHLKRIDPAKSWAKELIQNGLIAGIDIDPKAVTAARLHLWQRLIEEPDALPLPNLATVIIIGDGLDQTTWSGLRDKWDIVLGNPPFLATHFLTNRDVLVTDFQTAKGRFDFSSLFIEQALKVLSEDGRFGLVVPNRIFRSRSGGALRELLSREAEILALVDFGTTRPFDADAYVACLIARKRTSLASSTPTLRVVEVMNLEATFVAALLLQADRNPEFQQTQGVRAFDARYPTGDRPWLLISEAEQLQRITVEDVSVRLDSIASIPQGIRTGANDLFLFELLSGGNDQLCKVVNGLGETAIIEGAVLERVVYGTQVKRYQQVLGPERLIYPYRNNVALSETQLAEQYPHAWSYFCRNRTLLSARASLKKSNGKFYELVWPRDLGWLRRPKLMIRDLAPSTAFAVDPWGEIFLVGGTAVVPENPDLLFALMAYLNSKVVNDLLKHTTSHFRGSFQKFEPQHIQAIPVLDRLVEDETLSSRLSLMARRIVGMDPKSEDSRKLEQAIEDIVAVAIRERGLEASN